MSSFREQFPCCLQQYVHRSEQITWWGRLASHTCTSRVPLVAALVASCCYSWPSSSCSLGGRARGCGLPGRCASRSAAGHLRRRRCRRSCRLISSSSWRKASRAVKQMGRAKAAARIVGPKRVQGRRVGWLVGPLPLVREVSCIASSRWQAARPIATAAARCRAL